MRTYLLILLSLFLASCNGGSGGGSAGSSSSGIKAGSSVVESNYSQSIQDIASEVKTEKRYQISTEEVGELDTQVDLSNEEKEAIKKYL